MIADELLAHWLWRSSPPTEHNSSALSNDADREHWASDRRYQVFLGLKGFREKKERCTTRPTATHVSRA